MMPSFAKITLNGEGSIFNASFRISSIALLSLPGGSGQTNGSRSICRLPVQWGHPIYYLSMSSTLEGNAKPPVALLAEPPVALLAEPLVILLAEPPIASLAEPPVASSDNRLVFILCGPRSIKKIPLWY
jgi:hypothetical protein